MRTGAAAILVLVACGSSKPPEEPKQDDRVKALETELAKTKDDLAKATATADDLRKNETDLKAKADEAAALQAKLAEAVGQNGEVTTADGAVKLELIDQILFPIGEAELTPSGKDVLAKVGAALGELGDKQIWVQGHTDDQPILPRKPKPPKGKPAKPAKPDPKAKDAKPDTNDAVLPFVTNWELSAARSLTVVHYLQDDAKIDPTRLAAVAFGQYRPVSKTKAKNRRIEIVLYPRAKIAPK
ncbi:MAG TPA: OmpA family protein [Kofleriaceae bacterium]|jgi:chemotaxis protein MotB|nr:OmpA family protein [Kofleriaceae bacterium]